MYILDACFAINDNERIINVEVAILVVDTPSLELFQWRSKKQHKMEIPSKLDSTIFDLRAKRSYTYFDAIFY